MKASKEETRVKENLETDERIKTHGGQLLHWEVDQQSGSIMNVLAFYLIVGFIASTLVLNISMMKYQVVTDSNNNKSEVSEVRDSSFPPSTPPSPLP